MFQVVHGSFEVSCFNKVPLSDLLPDLLPDALKNRQDLLEKGYIVPVKRVLAREPKGNRHCNDILHTYLIVEKVLFVYAYTIQLPKSL